MRSRSLAVLAALLAAALCVPAPLLAKKKSKSKKARVTATPTPTPGPLYGPPAPTPLPLLRAAGTCLDYEPGQFLVVAEVGATGRMFRIDKETEVTTPVRKGSRVRVLYVEEGEGPRARKVLPGPVEAPPKGS